MNPQDLFTFEDLSTKVYQPTNPDEQKNAEKALQVFQTIQYIPQLQFVMENSTSAYAQLYASVSFGKIFNKNWQSISSQRFVELREYLALQPTSILPPLSQSHSSPLFQGNWGIGFLGNRGPEMNRYLLASFVQLVSTLTKYAWNVEDASDPVTLISQFLQVKSVVS
jgi:exportin-7